MACQMSQSLADGSLRLDLSKADVYTDAECEELGRKASRVVSGAFVRKQLDLLSADGVEDQVRVDLEIVEWALTVFILSYFQELQGGGERHYVSTSDHSENGDTEDDGADQMVVTAE